MSLVETKRLLVTIAAGPTSSHSEQRS